MARILLGEQHGGECTHKYTGEGRGNGIMIPKFMAAWSSRHEEKNSMDKEKKNKERDGNAFHGDRGRPHCREIETDLQRRGGRLFSARYLR